MSASTLKTALIQLASGPDKAANLEKSLTYTQQAITKGATLIVLPEVFNWRGKDWDPDTIPEPIPGPSTRPFQSMAATHRCTIVLGSLYEKSSDPAKSYTTTVVIAPDGGIAATYRKQHLFDVTLADGTAIRESDRFLPGDHPVLTTINGIPTGLSICYDLRFPELYRDYAQKGAKLLLIPSAFTAPTGQAHWETLVRARAIENQCFVLAPNQTGTGGTGVPSFGTSLAVDPWGALLAKASETKEETHLVTLDFQKLEEIRRTFPVLSHRRLPTV